MTLHPRPELCGELGSSLLVEQITPNPDRLGNHRSTVLERSLGATDHPDAPRISSHHHITLLDGRRLEPEPFGDRLEFALLLSHQQRTAADGDVPSTPR